MKLQNDSELQNTRRKLLALEALIAAKEAETKTSAAPEFALRGMRSTAQKLLTEIKEYEQTHQTA